MPLNTDVNGHLHLFSPRKPYHRVARSLLWGCSKDVPSCSWRNEWDERKTENINIIKEIEKYYVRMRRKRHERKKVVIVFVMSSFFLTFAAANQLNSS